MFYNVIRSENDPNLATKDLEVYENASPEDIIDVESYQETHDVSIDTKISVGPLLEDRSSLPTFFRVIQLIVRKTLRAQASVIGMTGNQDLHRSSDGRVSFLFDVWNYRGKKPKQAPFHLFIHMELHINHMI